MERKNRNDSPLGYDWEKGPNKDQLPSSLRLLTSPEASRDTVHGKQSTDVRANVSRDKQQKQTPRKKVWRNLLGSVQKEDVPFFFCLGKRAHSRAARRDIVFSTRGQ